MFNLPSLPYDYGALEPYIDAETMRIHHDKHHQAYTDNLNKVLAGQPDLTSKSVEELLTALPALPEEIRTKVRNNGGGYYNHSLFWTMMAPTKGGESKPGTELSRALETTFGDYNSFVEKLSTAAVNRFGSGWAWLILDGGKLAIMDTPNQDSPISEGKVPLLGIDVWEHAYYLKYQNRRADYVKAWWNVVNWPQVEQNFLAVR